jgi:NTE family protein
MATSDELAAVADRWNAHPQKNIDLVCEGGGVHGIGLVGAYSVLEENGYKVQNLAGTSSGAIITALIAADYTAGEIKEIIYNLDFSTLLDHVRIEETPIVGTTPPVRLLALTTLHGEYRGKAFEDTMNKYLGDRNKHTFGQLVRDSQEQKTSVYRYKLNVIASDVTGQCLLRLPVDAGKLGYDPDDFPIVTALRMSMSIPFFFVPVTWPNRQTGQDHTIVDGGMLSNFPVWMFDVQSGVPEWPTFGIKLVGSQQTDEIGATLASMPVLDTITYIHALVDTMTTFHDRLYLDTHSAARTITVPTGTLSSTNFNLTRADKDTLFASGQKAARDFLGSGDTAWNFGGYLAAFRSSSPRPQRQELIRKAMREAAATLRTP